MRRQAPELQANPLLSRLGRFLERQPKPRVTALGFALIVIMGLIDYWLASLQITFIFFYLVPIFIISWFTGPRAGISAALLCGSLSFAIQRIFATQFSNPLEIYFNSLSAFVCYLTVAHVVSTLRSRVDYEKDLARTDHATGAANRRAFFEALSLEIKRAQRHGHQFTVIMLDLDDFKLVNDQFGHTVGDKLLSIVVVTMQQSMRLIDLVARLGGDEFAILLPETDADSARAVVQRLQQDLVQAMRQASWPVTFSIGIATLNQPLQSAEAVMQKADALMYLAKHNGKNRIEQKIIE